MDTWLFRPPVLVGERIVWLGSGSGLPQGGVVRWIGKLPEMGPDWTVGVELDSPLPYGGIDGTWGSRHLFTCEPKHGLLVPLTKTIKECELYQWSKESIENNLKYGNGGTELFAKVQPGPSPSVSRPQTFPTPLASASKLVTSEEPRPAVRRRKRQLQEPIHDVQPATQQPKAPKRKVKSEVFNLLPKIDESNKENSRSPVSSSNTLKSSSSDFQTLRSSPNDFNTVRSSPNDFNTVRSSPNDFNTVTSSPNDFNTVRSSPDDFSTIRSSPIDFGTLKSSSNDFNTLKSSLNDYNTLKTCTSGDYSDYQWFDAKDEKNCNLDYKNCVNEPFEKQCHVIEGQQIRIIKENSCQRIEVKTPNHGEVQIERMSEFSVHTRCDMQDDDSSYEDAAATVDGFYPEQFRERSNTDSASRREKTASGFFSFLRWFRKGKDDGEDNDEEAGKAEFARGLAAATVPSSPELVRSTSSSCGSIDTIFSTATVSSFAFVSPTAYRPFGSANQPEKRIAVGPDTDTYRNRLQQRDRLRELDRNLTLKKKYHLFGSGTILKSGVSSPEPSPLVGRKNKEATDPNDHVTQTSGSRNSTGRKKRKAPDPPDGQKPQFSDNSLPNSLDKCRSKSNSMDNGEPVAVRRTRHRRTVSDSAKDKKAGAYCHVKGKRKAPQPPTNTSEQGGSTLERFRNQFASFGKKKRPAPQPPEESKKKRESKEDRATQSYQERSKSTGGQFSQEEKERLIANIAKLKAHADRKSMSLSPPVQDNMNLEQRGVQEHVVCNDSLKLERGVLKPNKELPKMDAVTTSDNKGAPVSPRPWYKRSLTNKDGLGGLKRDIFKSLEKKKDKEKDKDDEWMPEAGIPRIVGTGISSDGNSCSSTSSKFNIFARLDRSDDKKKEGEKRKSQVSMLANISELDREAAEIVQKEQAREQALMAAHDAKFYSYPDVPMIDGMETRFGEEVNENVEVPKRSSARELISLFNAIGNVTKVTVNSSFFSKDGSGFFSKEGIEKRFSFMGESVRTTEQRVVIGEKTYEQKESVKTNQSFVIDSSSVTESASGVQKSASESSQSSRVTGASDINGASAASGVTIEEIEDDLEKSSRSRAMYEANKSRRHHSPSPSIPTIAEQSESASSVATTPASTLSPHPGSNRSSGIIPEDAATGIAPDALQHAKRITIWSCPRCTLENPRWKITCDACGRWRPSLIDEKQDSPKCDEPFQRPTSPLHDVKKPTTNKVQVIKMELSKKGSGINWEEELKRYLPRDGMQPTKNSEKPSDKTETKGPQATEGPGQSIAKISVDGVQLDASTPAKVGSGDGKGKSEDIFANKSKTAAAPPTFIGGKLKQDKDKETKDTNKNKADDSIGNGNVMVNGTGPTVEEPDVDEVRKARLAFFKKTSESNDQAQSQVTLSGETFVASPEKSIVTEKKIHSETNGELYSKEASGIKKQIDENEQMKLREMLKEMKNSLPKRPKKISVGASKGSEATNGLIMNGLKEEELSESTESGGTVGVRETQKLGAIKKVPQKTAKLEPKSNLSEEKQQAGDKMKLQNGVADDDKKAEALFITKTTVYEDIKVKKSSGNKPMKVSTSVQTSAVMRKIEPGSTEPGEHTKPPSGKSSDMVPITVEEFSTTGIKDGVLYTSLSKDSRRIGKGTFELIKARDFASIEATKTSGESTAVHVYANVPSSPSDSTPSEQKSDVIKDGSVTQPAFPSQQPTSVVKQSSEPTGNTRNESEKVQGKIQKEKITQSVEKKPPSSGETSRATSSITSPDSDSNKGGGRRSSRATSEASNYSAASISSGDYSEVERLTAQLTLPKGIADFKADLQAAPPEQNMNTLAINRLLRRLEAAIAGGQHNQAAVLAKDLARLKISCSVTRQRRSLDASPASIMVDMYVEDKVSHQGPIPLQVIPTMTVAQLKEKVEEEFEIPVGVQRWILGKMLASDDSKTLQEHNVNSNGCPMFLYLVAPDGEQEGEPVATAVSPEKCDSAEPVAQVQRPPPPEADRPGGWYYNDEEDRYSFCEDTESEMTDDERDGGSRGASPVKDDRPAKSFEESNRKAAEEADNEEEDDDDDDEEDDNDDDDGDGGLVGASAVVIHEKPVVLQAPLVGRPFVKPTPPFLKANTGQQTDQQTSPSSSQASQVRRPVTPQETAGTSQATRHMEQKTGTLQLGWKCPVCTLVNSPTRPGCAACTTERPLRYVVPVEYRASEQELQRMKQEQQVDNELQQVTAEEKRQEAEKQHQHYLQLVNLDNTDLVPSVEPFECSVCLIQYGAGDGVVLRDCLHIFCRPCLANTVQFNEEAEVKCPYRDADYACNSVLQEREIKALVPPDVYEQHLAKSVAQAENKIGNAFHCKTPDCRGWCIFEDNVNEFRCPVCRRTNCLTCQAIHDGMNCKQYQEQVKQASETNAEARRTKEMLEEMVERGEAMNCPTCQVILMKKWGCDWLRCSMCKTEICWVTRGPRWGPGGKGDTTGGCQCGVNGVKCHPRCNYCH